MKRQLAVVLMLTMTFTPAATADEWSDAAVAVVRLSPSRFRSVPPAVIAVLVDDGCLIPQASHFEKVRHNIIKGHFASPGQIDYAALCSKNGTSHIKIVWGGPIHCEPRLAEGKDEGYLQGYGADGIVYSRAIYPATQKTIAYFYKELGNSEVRGLLIALMLASTTTFLARHLLFTIARRGVGTPFRGWTSAGPDRIV